MREILTLFRPQIDAPSQQVSQWAGRGSSCGTHLWKQGICLRKAGELLCEGSGFQSLRTLCVCVCVVFTSGQSGCQDLI